MTMDQQFDAMVGRMFDQAVAPLVKDPKLLAALQIVLKESYYAGASALMEGGCTIHDGLEERARQRRQREIEVRAHVYGRYAELHSKICGRVQ